MLSYYLSVALATLYYACFFHGISWIKIGSYPDDVINELLIIGFSGFIDVCHQPFSVDEPLLIITSNMVAQLEITVPFKVLYSIVLRSCCINIPTSHASTKEKGCASSDDFTALLTLFLRS